MTDGNGIPLATVLTGANRHDVTQLLELVDRIPTLQGPNGRPRRRPAYLFADRAYYSRHHLEELRQRGITPLIPRQREGHGSGLGIFRWVVERSIAWIHAFRRLRVRYDRRADIHEGFLALACSLVCWNALTRSLC